LLEAMGEEFWAVLREFRCHIFLSLYPPFKGRLPYWKELVDFYKVPFMHVNDRSFFSEFRFDPLGGQDKQHNFSTCYHAVDRLCVTLQSGRMYPCASVAGVAHKHNPLGLVLSERDYVDIYKAEDFQPILDFYAGPTPFCGYCVDPPVTWSNLDMPWESLDS